VKNKTMRQLLYSVVRQLLEGQAKYDVAMGNTPRRTSKAYVNCYAREYANAEIISHWQEKAEL
jgi:hypothetical protein